MDNLGIAIEAAERALAPIPVLRRNEAMIEAAASSNGRVGLLTTFGPTLETMPREFPLSTLAARALAAGRLRPSTGTTVLRTSGSGCRRHAAT